MRTAITVCVVMILAGLALLVSGCAQPLGRLNGDAAQPWDIESEAALLASLNAGPAAGQRISGVCGVFHHTGRHGRVALAQYGQTISTDLHEFCHSVDFHAGDWWAAYRAAQPSIAITRWQPIADRLARFCRQCDQCTGTLPHWRTLRDRFGADALGDHTAIIAALGDR